MGDDESTKRTREIDQLDVIRGLLDKLDAKIDAHRAEGQRRGDETVRRLDRMEITAEATRIEVERLNSRVTIAESDIRGLRDRDAKIMRQASETELEHEAAIGGAIAHVGTLEGDIRELREEAAKGNRVDQAVCGALGLDYAAIAASDEPTKPDALALRVGTLPKIMRENKVGIGVSAAVLVLQVLLEVLRQLQHLH